MDLITAKHLNDSEVGYEWACNICCETIRKLLVAVLAGKTQVNSNLILIQTKIIIIV